MCRLQFHRSLVKMDLSEKISFMFLLFQLVLSGVVGQTNKLIHHNNGLSYGFYDQSCPQLETIVRGATQTFLLSDPTTAAGLLRLMFHDCQVQGCDASILIDSFQSEMRSGKNSGVHKREVINAIKSVVEAACPRLVSCADILVLAARDSVALSGGPPIDVPLGRRDSSNPPNYRLADSFLPPATTGVDAMLRLFDQKGLTVEESVAIIGAHTIGATHCVNVRRGLFDSKAQRGNKVPADLAALLSLNCPMGPSTANISTVPNDLTSLTFDNRYYVNAMSGRGVLNIDAAMPIDPRTAGHVKSFAANEEEFFRAFSSAFVKLSSSNVLTGKRGVIRRNCDTLY